MVEDLNNSVLASIGGTIAWLFRPVGFGNWQSVVATITGLIAKENVVNTFGILYGGFDEVAEDGVEIWGGMQAAFTPLAAYSFLVFNLLCAPCFAAMGAIKREMNNWKWTLGAIGYQCGFAYAVALMIYQFGMLVQGDPSPAGLTAAGIVAAFMLYMLFRPSTEEKRRRELKHAMGTK